MSMTSSATRHRRGPTNYRLACTFPITNNSCNQAPATCLICSRTSPWITPTTAHEPLYPGAENPHARPVRTGWLPRQPAQFQRLRAKGRPTRSDGIQNGSETGVDCGSHPVPPLFRNSTHFVITLDNYPTETSWRHQFQRQHRRPSGGIFTSGQRNTTVNTNINLAAGNYAPTILDSYGDGICCSYGNGSYNLSDGAAPSPADPLALPKSTPFCTGGSGPTCVPTAYRTAMKPALTAAALPSLPGCLQYTQAGSLLRLLTNIDASLSWSAASGLSITTCAPDRLGHPPGLKAQPRLAGQLYRPDCMHGLRIPGAVQLRQPPAPH